MTIISGFEGMTEGQAIRNLSVWRLSELNAVLRQCDEFLSRRASGADFEYAGFVKFCILRVLGNRKINN